MCRVVNYRVGRCCITVLYGFGPLIQRYRRWKYRLMTSVLLGIYWIEMFAKSRVLISQI